jgi:hypothetical protein
MACIIVKGPNGERTIPENTPYPAGERLVGVDYNCNSINVQDIADQNLLETELKKAGIPWGDAVAWVAKGVGARHCSGCEARRVIMNRGIKETVKAIKEGRFGE